MNRCADTTAAPDVRSDGDGPFATVNIGGGIGNGVRGGSGDGVVDSEDVRPRAIRVRIRNAVDEPRRLSVEVSRGARILVDRTVEFPAGGSLELVLNEPADYRVRVGLADGDPTAVNFSRSSFGSAAETTRVAVLPDGRVETTSAETVVGNRNSAVADADADIGGADRKRRAVEP